MLTSSDNCSTCLHVRGLRLGDGLVELVSGRNFVGETLVDFGEALGQDANVVLQLALLLFLVQNLFVQFIALRTQVLNT